MYLKLF